MARRLLIALLLLLALASASSARVLSYAPYSNRLALPSINHRTSRYFALVEALDSQFPINRGQVVMYDTLGLREPRVIYPSNPSEDRPVFLVALRERYEGDSEDTGVLVLIGAVENNIRSYFISFDSGGTFRRIPELDGQAIEPYQFFADFGGPFTRGPLTQVSMGRPYPFVISTVGHELYGITFNGTAQKLYSDPNGARFTLIGRDVTGTRLLVRNGSSVAILDTRAPQNLIRLAELPSSGTATGWLTPTGSAYLQITQPNGRFLYYLAHGGIVQVGGPYATAPRPKPGEVYDSFFAVPTTEFDGAWMIQRDRAQPTTLSRHSVAKGLEKFWTALSGPEVEGLYTASTDPDQLLLQVHRTHGASGQTFLDPALAVWHTGEPPPETYHELFVTEEYTKAFLHVDVDTITNGSPFVFDAGIDPLFGYIIPFSAENPAPAGADIGQEWGVVRGSFRQRLLIPGVARQVGAFGSDWRTDVVIHNPLDEPQRVTLHLLEVGTLHSESQAATKMILAPHEIRVLRDVVGSQFNIEQGGGSLVIDPDVDVTATARTYTRAGAGTFGFGIPAIDALNTPGARFLTTYAGAFPGPDYRTNMMFTDTSGRGSEARLFAYGHTGLTGATDVALSVPVNGVLQMNGLSGTLAIPQSTGALVVQPTYGASIATIVAIDNRTNDPTYFPPDIPAPDVRTIPVFGHVDGANGSRFRSDLYLVNPSTHPNTVYFEIKRLDTNEVGRRIGYILAAGESRVIRDALMTMTGMTGLARLRFTSGTHNDTGVRVTSRTYTENADGGTYGCLVPPLNSFQSGTSGERLAILGVTGGGGFRTNVGLVDLNATFNGTSAEAFIRIVDDKGVEIDGFDVVFPTGGGIQVNDLFRTRGIQQPEAAMIYVDVRSGLVAAYATLTDNVTNDSTYLAANLTTP